ncbi:DoxX family protein [Amycolatopsis sp.]|jgi:uncharacterized membrane protein YphA (DoxX/SURF4 family)|uniref:DoxX family protein n=1 Tax=Amycolatopsis sp. TaxID=37632 RepID=UPI002E06D286|nr:DoxX family protein [Amycolatopsis sp.]
MNVVIWIVQGLLAVAFLFTGGSKLVTPGPKLEEQMSWMDNYPKNSVRYIGAVEVLAAIGLILPAATKIAPVLTPLAAVGLVIVMVGATITHLKLNEAKATPVTIVLALLSLFVAITRFGPYSI